MDNTSRARNSTTTYLRVLEGETPAEADWWAARELIDAGYATGKYQVSRARDSHGEVVALVGFAPTMAGRIYADQLQELLKARRSNGRLRVWVIGLASAAGGMLASGLAGLLTEWMKRVLGW